MLYKEGSLTQPEAICNNDYPIDEELDNPRPTQSANHNGDIDGTTDLYHFTIITYCNSNSLIFIHVNIRKCYAI